MPRRVSLAELAADGIQLHPAEAAAVVSELCRQHAHGEIHGIPSPADIRINSDGEVIAHGPMTGEDATVARAGHLLSDLIPDADAPAAYRASGGLRLVIARALGILDLPPYSGLEEFRAALVRFAGPDPVATMRGLFQRWESALVPWGPQPVTAVVAASSHGRAMIAAPPANRYRSRPFASALALGVAALLGLGAIGIAVGSAQQGRPAEVEAPVVNRLGAQPPPAGRQRTTAVRQAGTVVSSGRKPTASAARTSAARPRARQVPPPRREVARKPLRAAALEPSREAGLEPRHEAALEPDREADQARPEVVRRPSFFKRELFRIKIK